MRYDPSADIFKTDAQCIINPVNCVGVMGKGLARAFKEKFPALMGPYTAVCEKRLLKPGGVQLVGFRADGSRAPKGEAERIVANVATKDHWRDPSKLEWVDRGLEKLANALEERNVTSVAIPMLGAGLGGLPWEDVRESIETHFRPLAEKGMAVTVLGEGPAQARPDAAHQPKVAGSGKSEEIYYAGIGARDTPPSMLKKMTAICAELAREGYVLRSGGAGGADTACEEGCDQGGGRKEIYLPWEGFSPTREAKDKRFSDGEQVFCETSDRHDALARKFHPAFDRLGSGAQRLMARNGSQMYGRDLETPSTFVLCWTEGGRIKGGTGQALRMAHEAGAQVLNLGDPRVKDMSAERLSGVAKDLGQGVALSQALKSARRSNERAAEL